MFACRCRIAGKCLHDRMIDQISIQSRIVCTSTVNCLTFVFTSTLTHLQHPPSVWPCIGNVNTVPWLLIDKACFDIVLLCKLTSHFCLHRCCLSLLSITGLSSESGTRSGLEKFFQMKWRTWKSWCAKSHHLALSYFTDCLVNPWCVPLRT